MNFPATADATTDEFTVNPVAGESFAIGDAIEVNATDADGNAGIPINASVDSFTPIEVFIDKSFIGGLINDIKTIS